MQIWTRDYEEQYRGRVRRASRRPARALVALLALSLVLGWWQAGANRAGRRTVPEQAALAMLLPLQGMVQAVGEATFDAAYYLPRAAQVTAENAWLRRELGGVRAENARLREQQLMNQRLQRLVGLRGRLPAPAVAAALIGRGTADWSPLLTLDAGYSQGVRRGQVVVSPAGVVGQVYTTTRNTCTVVPVWDRTSGVACLVQRSREPGVAKGAGEGRLRLCYLRTDADVRPGDVVVCSGVGGVFPKGLVIGRVSAAAGKGGQAVKTALLQPQVDPGRLEEVFILRTGGR